MFGDDDDDHINGDDSALIVLKSYRAGDLESVRNLLILEHKKIGKQFKHQKMVAIFTIPMILKKIDNFDNFL